MKYNARWLLLLTITLVSCLSPKVVDSIPPETASISTDIVQPDLVIDPNEPPPARAEAEFKTDFTIHNIPYSEVLSGGPPKDGIPAIDNPSYVSLDEADEWLGENEPVIYVEVNGVARAYPLQILMWHEIVNDVLNDEPLIVTFCPLCNTAIIFKRTFDGQVLDFGTTGRLRFSNLIMYDRQTETWWQQATGEGIAGKYTGESLEYYPAVIISWDEFKTNHPDGDVLSKETGFQRRYGENPYVGYDDINNVPFLYKGNPTPNELTAVARVITIDLDDEAVAYPYEIMEEIHVVNDIVGGENVVVFWQAGVASALDGADIASSRDVGTAATFSREIDRMTLSFSYKDSQITDDQTKSVWNIFGEAIEGELTGTKLSPVVSINHFWFSWAAFKPDTRIYQP